MMTQRVWWAWLLLPGFVMAAELELIGDTVQLHGKIVAQPCVVAPESIDQTVTMGAVGTKDLEMSSWGPKVPFKIRLTGCSTATKKNVIFTFSGTVAQRFDYQGLAFSRGSARGAGIFLSDSAGPPLDGAIQIGLPTRGYPIMQGNTELTFYAQLGRLHDFTAASPITAGDYTAVTTFMVTYQ